MQSGALDLVLCPLGRAPLGPRPPCPPTAGGGPEAAAGAPGGWPAAGPATTGRRGAQGEAWGGEQAGTTAFYATLASRDACPAVLLLQLLAQLAHECQEQRARLPLEARRSLLGTVPEGLGDGPLVACASNGHALGRSDPVADPDSESQEENTQL